MTYVITELYYSIVLEVFDQKLRHSGLTGTDIRFSWRARGPLENSHRQKTRQIGWRHRTGVVPWRSTWRMSSVSLHVTVRHQTRMRGGEWRRDGAAMEAHPVVVGMSQTRHSRVDIAKASWTCPGGASDADNEDELNDSYVSDFRRTGHRYRPSSLSTWADGAYEGV